MYDSADLGYCSDSLLQCASVCILMQHTTHYYVMNIHTLLAQPVLLKNVN